MNEKQKKYLKIVIVAVLIIGIALAVYFFVIKPKMDLPPVKNPGKNPGDGATPPIVPEIPKGDDKFPLKIGSYGDNVAYLQRAINKINPKANLKANGDFQHETYLALVTFIGTSHYPVTTLDFNSILETANAIH